MQIITRLIPLAALLATCGSAATYYVDTGGNDANSGSAQAPFQTLARGVRAAVAGDTVIVRDGTYGHGTAVTGGDLSTNEESPVVLSNSGTPNAWITIRADHKWGAVLDCEMLCDAYIDLHNASYIVIQDFVITRGYKEGIHSNNAAHHIVLRGNEIEYVANRPSLATYGLDGMYTSPNCHDFFIDGNVFHDIGRSDANWLDHGLYLHGSNFTITNNLFYNIQHGFSIQTAAQLSNVLIANNTFAFPSRLKQGWIMLWQNQVNLVIRNNIFYDFPPRSVNNAIRRMDSTLSDCFIDHNLFYGATGLIDNAAGCVLSGNTIGVNPQFMSASAPYDFQLTRDSPAIGAGVVIPGLTTDIEGGTRPQDVPPDLGAYQFRDAPLRGRGNPKHVPLPRP
jgi:parallel beta helix pectate lyase-like protein/pectate lyase-like protein